MNNKMQRATKKDEYLKARRERNRQAQHDFRRRRQAAEEAQRRRINHLENTIEELSNLLIGICDEMLGAEEVAGMPRLMARLQRSTTQALKLAKSVSDTSETAAPQESDGDKAKDDNKNNEIQAPKISERKTADSVRLQTWPYQAAPGSEVSTDTDLPPLGVDMDDGNHFVTGGGLTPIEPPIEHSWAQPHSSALDKDSFPVRLVETTLSQACLFLKGDVYISKEDAERAFGSSLRFRTRLELVASMQWLLGPGRNEIHEAMGMNWNPLSAQDNNSYLRSFLPSSSMHTGHESPDTGLLPEHLNYQNGQLEFLTALGVQELLQSLGAQVLNPNTMELKISRPTSRQSGTGSNSSSGAFLKTSSLKSTTAATFIVRLDTSLLVNNLAYMATCQERGPVYPRYGVARAVEASVIMAR